VVHWSWFYVASFTFCVRYMFEGGTSFGYMNGVYSIDVVYLTVATTKKLIVNFKCRLFTSFHLLEVLSNTVNLSVKI